MFHATGLAIWAARLPYWVIDFWYFTSLRSSKVLEKEDQKWILAAVILKKVMEMYHLVEYSTLPSLCRPFRLNLFGFFRDHIKNTIFAAVTLGAPKRLFYLLSSEQWNRHKKKLENYCIFTCVHSSSFWYFSLLARALRYLIFRQKRICRTFSPLFWNE